LKNRKARNLNEYGVAITKNSSMLSFLSAREQEILKRRYGVENGHCQTYREIGIFFNVNPERIRQIEYGALRKLRCQDVKHMAENIPIPDRPIEVLDLTTRSYDCLLRSEIKTVKELLMKTHADLSRIRNVGKKSLLEIDEKLKSLGLKLKEDTK
jgi:DNA-directed RNA polymerase alpha subunit